MKKPMGKRLAGLVVVGGLAAALAIPAYAACNTQPYYRPTSPEKARETISGQSFDQPDVSINPKTHTVYNVYDCNGNLVSATLSTDCHWYIVPTDQGNLLIGTGW
ncbi:MAG: hypothetical protein PHO10_02055 [Gemmiger sp.]|nr:hypothetical protein [Gemmiger sp.]